MTRTMDELRGILRLRLERAERIARQGVIPGELDSLELEQLIGGIKEMKHIIDFIELHTQFNCDHDWQEGRYLFRDIYCAKCQASMPEEDEIKYIKHWFANRPSASMDFDIEKRERMIDRLRHLKNKRRAERLPTAMMDSQRIEE